MTMAHGEKILRESGDPRDVAYADMIAAILASRGEDIPLPEVPRVTRSTIGERAIVGARFPGGEAEVRIPSLEAPENSGKLAAEIQEMSSVRAVVDAMYAKAPSVEENGRFGRQIRSIDWDWTHSRPGAVDTLYDFEIKYDTDRGNAPLELKVVKGKEKGWGGITVVANQDNRGLTELQASFSSADYKHAATFPGIKTNERGDIIDVPPFLRDYVRGEYTPPKDFKIDINLEVNKLAVVISRKYVGDRSSVDTYVFNPDKNCFEGRRDEQATLPEQTPEAFMQLIEDALRVIPVDVS